MSLFRQLVATAKPRSLDGCWTCRVRRKKCAENRPVCDTCKALEITCYFDDEKPAWMDGGPRQREMAGMIKAQVKRQASQRRDRRYLEMLEMGTSMVTVDDDAQGNSPRVQGRASSTPAFSGNEAVRDTGSGDDDTPWHLVRQGEPDVAPAVDLNALMIYLDYVFPYLFPHYRPSVQDGGRAWILDVLQSNRSLYHTTVSLASFFFAVVLARDEEGHGVCTGRLVDKLETQLALALEELQKEVRALDACGAGFDRPRGLVAMQSIVQLLCFEVATSNKDNWRIHLDAAVALFVQMLPEPERWNEMLQSLYSLKWPPPDVAVRRPWSTNQAALRFFTVTLLYVDVLSSVTLGDVPRLYRYQASIMPGCPPEDDGARAGPLSLEEFFGLENWVVQALGDVAALESWKRRQQQTGSLSVEELVSRGQVLGDAIRGGHVGARDGVSDVRGGPGGGQRRRQAAAVPGHLAAGDAELPQRGAVGVAAGEPRDPAAGGQGDGAAVADAAGFDAALAGLAVLRVRVPVAGRGRGRVPGDGAAHGRAAGLWHRQGGRGDYEDDVVEGADGRVVGRVQVLERFGARSFADVIPGVLLHCLDMVDGIHKDVSSLGSAS